MNLANLILPLALERRGRDDKHARRAPKTFQQRARGDGLDGFAKTHFVGEQRAFGEGQMQHALALIRKQRHARLVRRPFACVNFQLIFAAQLLALGPMPPRFEPWNNFLREPQLRQISRAQFLQHRECVIHRGVGQTPVIGKPFPHGGRQPFQPALDA